MTTDRWKLTVGGAGTLLASFYCFLGVIQAASLSGAPNYPLDRARFNVRVWGLGAVVFLALAIILFVKALRRSSHARV